MPDETTRGAAWEGAPLPPAAVIPIPLRAGVLRLGGSIVAPPRTSPDRHDAEAQTVRTAVALSFASAREIAWPPDPTDRSLDVLVVAAPEHWEPPGRPPPPGIWTAADTSVRYRIAVTRTDGELLWGGWVAGAASRDDAYEAAGTAPQGDGTVMGTLGAGTRSLFATMTRDAGVAETELYRALLRNLGAHVVAALDAVREAPAVEPADTPLHVGGASGQAPIRLERALSGAWRIEGWIARCLSGRLRRPPSAAHANLHRLVRDAVFPWLEPGLEPSGSDPIGMLLARPGVVRALLRAGFGTIVAWETSEPDIRQQGGIVAGTTGAVGLAQTDQSFVVTMSAWDVATRSRRATRSYPVFDSQGVVGVLVPIPFRSGNWPETCDALREFVREASG